MESGRKVFAEDVPWRASAKGRSVPRISQAPVLAVRHTPNSSYALSIMKHPDPIGKGLASEAFLEAAGPDCLVPGQVRPIKLLGLQLWPIEVNWKFMTPIAREMKTVGKLVDSAFDLMNASFGDR